MATVVIVPGLAVRTYAEPAAAAAASRGHHVVLRSAPGWRGQEADLPAYGSALAARLEADGEDVDLLVGLSVGTQAAAVTAAETERVRRLLLVSPTVDPRFRTLHALLRPWLGGDPAAADPPLRLQATDWWLAGVPRIVAGLRSALDAPPLEDVLPVVRADVVVVHAQHDSLGDEAWAADCADRAGGRLLVAPGAPHSWPYGDTNAFADLVDRLVA